MLKIHKYARKPFYVDAVRVTRENLEEVANWCSGEIMTDDDASSNYNGQNFIKMKVHHPLNPRQERAYVGDWVLSAVSGFKIYTPKGFERSFEKVKQLTKEQADAAGIKVPHEPRQKKRPVPKPPANPVVTPEQAEQLKASSEVPTTGNQVNLELAKDPEKNEADRLIEEVLNG